MRWSPLLCVLMGQCSFLTCQVHEYHFIKESKNWSEARDYCREKHTDLATVHDAKDIERLCDKARCEEGWIGLHNRANGNRTWQWSLPGVEFKTNDIKWKDGEPNDKHQQEFENCGAVESGNLLDVSCTIKKPFICYHEVHPADKFIPRKEIKTWLEAQRYCREKHTDLISGIHQLNDPTLTKALNELNSVNEIFLIGLFRDTWKWSDNSPSSFRNWDVIPEESKGCAAITNATRWKNESCELKKPFFCYDDNVILIKQSKSWDEALYFCRRHHNDLVHITSIHEQRMVQKVAQEAGSPYVWLGLHYTCTLQFWFWVTDETVLYQNWASNASTNHCDMSGAMETGGEHKWYQKSDHNKYHFICSKK